jgi:hypothetical protein
LFGLALLAGYAMLVPVLIDDASIICFPVVPVLSGYKLARTVVDHCRRPQGCVFMFVFAHFLRINCPSGCGLVGVIALLEILITLSPLRVAVDAGLAFRMALTSVHNQCTGMGYQRSLFGLRIPSAMDSRQQSLGRHQHSRRTEPHYRPLSQRLPARIRLPSQASPSPW